jgi:very-short-patch-repair endonuclease
LDGWQEDPVADNAYFLGRAEMPKGPTLSENIVYGLMVKRFVGVDFEAEVPMPPYRLDFYSPALRLAFEFDGVFHRNRRAEDAQRDAFMTAKGIRTVRIPSSRVLDEGKNGLLRDQIVLAIKLRYQEQLERRRKEGRSWSEERRLAFSAMVKEGLVPLLYIFDKELRGQDPLLGQASSRDFQQRVEGLPIRPREARVISKAHTYVWTQADEFLLFDRWKAMQTVPQMAKLLNVNNDTIKRRLKRMGLPWRAAERRNMLKQGTVQPRLTAPVVEGGRLIEVGQASAKALAESLVKHIQSPKNDIARPVPNAQIEAIRRIHARAYLPWSADEDARLKAAFKQGATQEKLSAKFERQPSAIASRLKKLGLVE